MNTDLDNKYLWTWRGDNFLDAPSWVHGRGRVRWDGIIVFSGERDVYVHQGDTLVIDDQGRVKAFPETEYGPGYI